MRKTRLGDKIVALVTSLLCALTLSLSPAVAYAEVTVTRLAGPDRYQTMSAILDEVAKTGKLQGKDKAVIATGQNFPDALSATSLAGLTGPIILTRGDKLSPEAKAQLQKFNVKSGFAMGGANAISDNVFKELGEMGVTGTRLVGDNRQDTSFISAVYTTDMNATDSPYVILATGKNFADVLSIGPLAYATATPILLVGNDGLLTDAELKYLKNMSTARKVIMLGGTSVVSDGVKNQLGDSYEYIRIAGADRYETIAKIAEFEISIGFGLTAPAIATGTGFADALSGATLCGVNSSPILLVKGASGPTVDALKRHASEVSKLYVLGGESAVSGNVANGIVSAMSGAPVTGTTSGGTITALSSSSFDDAIAQSDKLVAVDFWADWCEPCKRFSPVVKEVAGEMSDKLQAYTLDIKEHPSIAMRYSISSIPCLILFKNGKEVGRLTGYREKSNLVSALNNYL